MALHLVFVDLIYGYTAARPEEDAPLGGTTSAVCFLAREMVKAGHRCTFINLIKQKAEAHGIPAYPFGYLAEIGADPSVSAFVFCGRWDAQIVETLRPLTRAPFIAWMHEACFEMANVPPLEAFDGAVFVSLWQAKANAGFIKLKWQQAVIRNGLNPRFADLFAPGESVAAAKAEPPVILYAGDYHRGGSHLLPILQQLKKLDSDFVFEAYTNAIGTADPAQAEADLAQLVQEPKVRHVGKVGQTELAQKMKRAALLLAPNPWPETSCINLIQALAAGLLCVTTDRAALRETGNGYTHMIPIADRDHLFHYDQPIDAEAFARTLAFILKLRRDYPQEVAERLAVQRATFLEAYDWKNRVGPWIEFLRRFS